MPCSVVTQATLLVPLLPRVPIPLPSKATETCFSIWEELLSIDPVPLIADHEPATIFLPIHRGQVARIFLVGGSRRAVRAGVKASPLAGVVVQGARTRNVLAFAASGRHEPVERVVLEAAKQRVALAEQLPQRATLEDDFRVIRNPASGCAIEDAKDVAHQVVPISHVLQRCPLRLVAEGCRVGAEPVGTQPRQAEGLGIVGIARDQAVAVYD